MKPQPTGRGGLLAELQRIEAEPEFRAAFLAGLSAAIDRRNAQRVAESEAWCMAVDRLRGSADPGGWSAA